MHQQHQSDKIMTNDTKFQANAFKGTSLKTKKGVIIDINDGIYIVRCPDEEVYVSLPDLQYNFIKNDKVRLKFNIEMVF